jgi:hypothetical protein
MALFAFYLRQIVLLGTLAFGVFLVAEWWQFGFYWAADTFEAWLIALATVAAFLLLVAAPLQMLSRAVAPRLSLVLGLVSGPLAVAIGLMTSQREFTYEAFVREPAVIHCAMAGWARLCIQLRSLAQVQ